MIKVYEYGCLEPETGGQEAMEQILLAHRYRNKLVELERARRAQVDPLTYSTAGAPHGARLEELLREMGEIREAVNTARKKARNRQPVDPQMKERACSILTEIRQMRPLARDERTAIRQQAAGQIQEINEEYRAAVRQARANASQDGLYWGTYLHVEAAHETACKACERETWRSDTPLENPALPRFLRFDGCGTLAVQLQGVLGGARRAGLPVERLMGSDDSRLRVDAVATPVPQRPRHDGGGSRRPAEARPLRRVWLRVGSIGHQPVWMSLPVVLHREIPLGGIITWAKVFRTSIGPHFRWKLQLTVDIPDVPARPGGGVAGVDVCWRRMTLDPAGEQIGLRVAVLVGDDGVQEELQLPSDWLQGLHKVEGIQSHRDQIFNEARDLLAAWLNGQGERLPDWVREDAKTLKDWRSTRRLAALIWRWRERRFPGDGLMWLRMEAWRRRDRHLWCYEDGLRGRLLRHRLHLYREFAHRVASRYGVVALEDMDLRVWARRARPEQEERIPFDVVRWRRKVACLSSLRICLDNALAATGGRVMKVDAAYTTQRCCECGHQEVFDAAGELVHRWACGHVHDQDDNAARNLMRAAQEGSVQEEVAAALGPRVSDQRYGKRLSRSFVAATPASGK